METATILTSITEKITELKIGWTITRVRPRRPVPARCYMFHVFGHSSSNCTEPELTTPCRRCVGNDYKEKDCPAGLDRFAAYKRSGHRKIIHRPGSGRCATWQEALDQPTKCLNLYKLTLTEVCSLANFCMRKKPRC